MSTLKKLEDRGFKTDGKRVYAQIHERRRRAAGTMRFGFFSVD